MKTTDSIDASILELVGNLKHEHRAVFDAQFNLLYSNRTYREYLRKLGFDSINNLSLLDIYNSEAKEHASLWLDGFKTLNPLMPSYAFSAFDKVREENYRIDAEVQALFKANQVLAYALGFDELTDTYLENRFNRLKSDFLAKALMVKDTNELMWVMTDEILSKLYLGDALILERQGNVLAPIAAYGSQRKGRREVAEGLKVSFSQGITGYVATTAMPYMTGDSRKDPHYIQEHFAAGSEVAVPIIVRGKVFGVINCESEQFNFFRPIHQELLQRTAEVLSARIEEMNSRQELELLEQRHLAIINSTPNSFLLFDPSYRIMSFNTAATKSWRYFTGLNIEVGTDYKKVVPKELLGKFENLARQSLQGGKAEEYLSWEHEDNHYRLKVNFAPALDREGKIFGFTLLIEDVSELYHANQTLRAKNLDLEQGNRELDKFVYSISHDLRAPLSSMMGLVNLIENAQQLPETKIYAKMLQDAAESMDSYIRNILEYSRNKRFEIDLEEVDLEELFRDLEQKFKFIPGYRELNFETDLSLKRIHSDPYRMEIILNNLISNAIKYRDIAKSKSWCKVSISERGEQYEIKVADNGIGIPKAKQANLFDMFFKVQSDHPGSGLGLYILKEVVNNLGGEIEVQSKEKKGSTFSILLPKNPHNA
jgi:signal transduction histidine kinase